MRDVIKEVEANPSSQHNEEELFDDAEKEEGDVVTLLVKELVSLSYDYKVDCL